MLLFLVSVFVLACILVFKLGKPNKLPPGPQGLPVIGNIHQIVKNPHIKLSQWALKYGKVYTVNLVGKTTLVVNEAKAMKEIFSSMASTGKLQSDAFECLYAGTLGIANSEGKEWLEQRQFMMKSLKQFGFGRGTMLEPVILGECDDLCEWIDEIISTGEEGIKLAQILMRVSSNTLWNMVVGKRMKSSESDMVYAMEEVMHELEIATGRGLAFSSNMKYWAPELSGYNQFLNSCQKVHKIVDKFFMEHKKAKEETGGQAADLMDAYIEQVENCKDTGSTFYGDIGWKSSFYSITALLVAGSETTGASINWLLFYLTVNPEMQRKLQKEIDSVVGSDRDPSLNHRASMPYLEAVILETLRRSTLSPFGLIHKLLETVEYKGYVIPKDTLLMANIYHCHYDKEIWNDPETFRPERFLEGSEAENKALKDMVVAFQLGRRICPGESLSKDLMFLFAAKLFQKYNFSPDPNVNVKEYLQPNVGFLLLPKPLGVVIRKRP